MFLRSIIILDHKKNIQTKYKMIQANDNNYKGASPQHNKPKKNKKKNSGPDMILAANFEPSAFTVVIGRGKKTQQTTGNLRLRVMANTFLPQYAEAMDRNIKTQLVNKIIDIMKDACKESCAFVRQTKGRWYEVAENVAREKISYVFRDLLADRYESSSKSKVAKRVQRRQQQQQEQYLQSHQDRFEEEEEEEEEDEVVISSLSLSNSQKDSVDAITCNMHHDFPTSDITIDISNRVEREDYFKSSTSPKPFSRRSLEFLLNLPMIECDALLEYNDCNRLSIFE
ncbi:MAG: hypothetical protein ACI90V_002957 [Bacillariaceae sp.]|jgi:hypothetical protein